MLWITPELTRKITSHAREQYPNEACGLLLGHEWHITDVVSAPNIAKDPRTSYRIEHHVLAKYLPDAIGFYHSHPDGRALPSRSDIQESCYPDYVYLIVGINKGTDLELAAWQIRNERVKRITLHISNSRNWELEPDTITPLQHYMIILSLLLGVVIVIIVSLILLPPAPPIP